MSIQFKDSQTKINLMKAFAGESQARNRYTFAAEEAREQGMFAISDVFLFTADQERAHAERFYDLLKSDEYFRLQRKPQLLREELEFYGSDTLVIIDEIQKIPQLLDEVHWLIRV